MSQLAYNNHFKINNKINCEYFDAENQVYLIGILNMVVEDKTQIKYLVNIELFGFADWNNDCTDKLEAIEMIFCLQFTLIRIFAISFELLFRKVFFLQVSLNFPL